MTSTAASGVAARQRVASIWLGVAVLALLVAVMFAAHASASMSLLHERVQQQSHAAATQAALQIGASLRHVADVVLHTKVAFEEFGPGLVERDPLSQARTDAGTRPYRFIAVLNATGDPALTLPAGVDVPSLPALAAELANNANARLINGVHRDGSGPPLLLQAHRLVYPDGTYAGAVVGALDPELVARTLQRLGDPRLLRLRVVGGRDDLYASTAGADGAGQVVAETMPIDGTPWTVQAALDRTAVRNQAWHELLPAALGSLAMWLLLAGGGMFLSRSLRREIDSELRAQSAASQAEMRSRFMAHMSHEIRTPINGVLGASELLAAAPLPPGQMRLVDVIRGSSQALLEIVNDLLDASRIDAGQVRVEERPFDAAATIEDVVELFAAPAQAKGLGLVQVIGPELPERLIGDPLRLRQVLTNLVSNAVKFTERGGVTVRCGVDADRRHWWVRVDDSGIGIAADDQQRLFRPFEQADASMARRFGGTGLGLWIARGLTSLMGGSLALESTPGVGTRLTMRLPLRQADAVDAAAGGPAATDLAALAGAHVRLVCADAAPLESLRQHLAPAGVTLHGLAADEAALFGGDAVDASRVRDDGADCDLVLLHAASFGLEPQRAWTAWQRLPRSRHETAVLVLARAEDLTRAVPLAWPGNVAVSVHAAPIRRRSLWAALAALRRGAAPIRSRPSAPVAPDQAPLPAASMPGAPDPGATPAIHVLAVEDNEVNQLILCESLRRLGCDVDLAADGEQALQAFAPGRYALVLMDCQMPLMDGYEATAAIRRREHAEATALRVPIVALTAHATGDDRARCLRAGMDDHLAKPYSLDQLQATLRRWTGAGAARATEAAGQR